MTKETCNISPHHIIYQCVCPALILAVVPISNGAKAVAEAAKEAEEVHQAVRAAAALAVVVVVRVEELAVLAVDHLLQFQSRVYPRVAEDQVATEPVVENHLRSHLDRCLQVEQVGAALAHKCLAPGLRLSFFSKRIPPLICLLALMEVDILDLLRDRWPEGISHLVTGP